MRGCGHVYQQGVSIRTCTSTAIIAAPMHALAKALPSILRPCNIYLRTWHVVCTYARTCCIRRTHNRALSDLKVFVSRAPNALRLQTLC